ncbi:MAG: CHC2 zinc finger domain-containing protein, partial [Bacteroidales bacterium]
MYINDIDKVVILDKSKGNLGKIVGEFVSLKKSGASLVGVCPHCGASNKLTITESKDIFKCFSCNEIQGKGAVAWLMKGQKMTYVDA